MYRMLVCLFLACAVIHGADAQPFPLWDGHESIADYAKRTNLTPMKTLDLGSGVNLELVLIPAGKFTMGTPEPTPVDEEGFRKKIVVGEAVFALGVGVLLVLIATVIIRAVRQRHRPQYSLARFTAMTIAAGVAVLGGMHWWFSTKALVQVEAEYSAALSRYQTAYGWEKPAHEVTLTTPYYAGKYEVTQEQYQQVMGANPSRFKSANLPVETVSWQDALEFCKKASEKTGKVVRLPTEGRWEYACRAGTATTYCTGNTESELGQVAWYGANSKNAPHPVGQKVPNAWGLHDMHGNVWEWCSNWHEEYRAEATADPQGPPQGKLRILRGGSWNSSARYCRSTDRFGNAPLGRFENFGFRVVVEVPPKSP